ncbi:hypothetical protein Pcinc_014653 [Petrolisthes cinctipes]|uniref:Pentraxin (PTX) domain-containing protein n=1 Tax=Petrolisthes cinctipes TaxID=88211 RepID=A0AAE1FXC8_PETCI|nr:hypothetical protein Pcinc_014653 [Petrolisthes cinctipes]
MLGQDQDTLGGGTDATQSFHGYIADLVMVDQLLTHTQMLDFTSCQGEFDISSSIVVDFSNLGDDFMFGVDTVVQDVGYEGACSGVHIHATIFPEARDFLTSHRFCSSLGTSLIVPENALENHAVTLLGLKYCPTDRIWLGVYKSANRSTAVVFGTNKTINYTEWEGTFRHDEDFNFVLVMISGWINNWGISTPDRQTCTVCGSDKPIALVVRGLCLGSNFDRIFHIHGYINNKPSFIGIKSSNISWMPHNTSPGILANVWMMWVSKEPNITATMVMESRDEYPVGTHYWNIDNDNCGLGGKTRLKFTSCPTHMFTCNDGLCIDDNLRCDKKVDCSDNSDEESCNSVLLPKYYDNNMSPPSMNKIFPISIETEAEFKSIRSIRIMELTLSLDLRLTIRWRDSRLRFKNLRHNLSHNLVDKLIWLPEFTITGADNIVADMKLRKDVNFMDRQSDALPDDIAELNEDKLYGGDGNDLVAVREWTLEIVCHYDLSTYPFDTQRCPVNIFLAKYTSNLFTLRVNNFTFTGRKRHHQYQVNDIVLSNITVDDYGGQQLVLYLRHQQIYYISAAYVPSSMLLVISYITYYFRLKEFSTRVSVALTSLLVLATLFSELVGSLPKTSYLKLIDVWFLGCIAANFGMVVCLVIIEKGRAWEAKDESLQSRTKPNNEIKTRAGQSRKSHLQDTTRQYQSNGSWFQEEKNDIHTPITESKLNSWMKVAIPIVLLIFTIIYVTGIIMIYN